MTNLRRLRIEQVVDKVAMPKSTIYDKIRAGTFPAYNRIKWIDRRRDMMQHWADYLDDLKK